MLRGRWWDCIREPLASWQCTFRRFGYEFSLRDLHPLLSRPNAERLGPALKKEQGKRFGRNENWDWADPAHGQKVYYYGVAPYWR